MSYNIPQQLAALIGATPNDQMHVVAMASPSGVPTPDGSWLSPWTSIQSAINAIEANYNAADPLTWFGTIWINPGQYLEDLTITFPGVMTIYTLGLTTLGNPPGTTQTITYDVSAPSPFGSQAELVFAALSPRPDTLNLVFPGGILLVGDFFLGGSTNKTLSIQNGTVMGEIQEVGGGGLTGDLNLLLTDSAIGGISLPDPVFPIYRFEWSDTNVLNFGGPPLGSGNVLCVHNPNPGGPPDSNLIYKRGRVNGVFLTPAAGTIQAEDVEFEDDVDFGSVGIVDGCAFKGNATFRNGCGINVFTMCRFSPTAPPKTILLPQAGNNPGWVADGYTLSVDGWTNDLIKRGLLAGTLLTSPAPPPAPPPNFNLGVVGDFTWP